MIGKAGAWQAATAAGAATIGVMALSGWWFAHMPRPRLAEAPQPAEIMASPPALPQQALSPQTPSPAPSTKAPEAVAPPTAPTGPRADVARALPNGEVVVAGRTAPGAQVALLDNGEVLMEMRADPASGEFVFLPPRLPAGEHKLTLRGAPAADGGQAAESAVMAFSIAPVVKAARAVEPTAPATAIVPPETRAPVAAVKHDMATIVRGDTLWRISREHLGHGALYPMIFQANAEKIRNPRLIYPGQSLTIP